MADVFVGFGGPLLFLFFALPEAGAVRLAASEVVAGNSFCGLLIVLLGLGSLPSSIGELLFEFMMVGSMLNFVLLETKRSWKKKLVS